MPVVRTLNFNAEEYSFPQRSLMSWMDQKITRLSQLQNGFWLGCVSPGPNQSKISFFHVPKGVMGKHGGSPKTILECCVADKFWKLNYSKCLDIWLLEVWRFIVSSRGCNTKSERPARTILSTWQNIYIDFFPFDCWPYINNSIQWRTI